ncbi:hypothetical protein C0991_009005 [Blastosporella zonata]|nr:hypothetical protein C0991_009005 [Blastosporella zonata]
MPLGTAIYVFFILANNANDTRITRATYCDFILDGATEGNFEHTPLATSDFEYNALVFSQTDLSNNDHTIVFTTPLGSEEHFFINFDYAVYTSDDNASSGPLPVATTTEFGGATTLPPTVLSGSAVQSHSHSSSSLAHITSSSIFLTSSWDGAGSTESGSSEPHTGQTTPDASNPTPTPTLSSNNGTDDPSRSINVGAIVGAAVGVTVFVGVILLVFVFIWRKQRRIRLQHSRETSPSGSEGTVITPFVLASSPPTRSESPEASGASEHDQSERSTRAPTSASLSYSTDVAVVDELPVRPGRVPELDRFMDVAKRRMQADEVSRRQRTVTHSTQDENKEEEITHIWQQLQSIKQQVDRVQEQSDWAQVLLNEPLPRY